MKLDHLQRSPALDQPCMICGAVARTDAPLCSQVCVQEAHRELDANLAVFRRRTADVGMRSALAARNGFLSSALIRSGR